MDIFEFSISLEDLSLLGTMRVDILLVDLEDPTLLANIINELIVTTERAPVVISSKQLMVSSSFQMVVVIGRVILFIMFNYIFVAILNNLYIEIRSVPSSNSHECGCVLHHFQ